MMNMSIICQLQLARYMYTKIILVETFTDLQICKGLHVIM